MQFGRLLKRQGNDPGDPGARVVHGPDARNRKVKPAGPWREMHDRYGFILRLFFRRFFRPIRFSPAQEARLREWNEQGHVVYVMDRASTLFYLFLNYTCLRLGLPLASYGNGIAFFFLYQPVGKVARVILARASRKRARGTEDARYVDSSPVTGLSRGSSMVLFLRRYRRRAGKRAAEAKDLLEELVDFQDRSERPVYLVPIGIVWGKRPERIRKGILDILLGGKESPGWFRQLLLLLRYARHSVVTIGESINLQEYLKANAHLEKDLLLKKVHWSLYREFDLARRQVTGPTIKPRRYILESILSSHTLREQARVIARAEGKSFEKVMKEAARYADEIAADYSIRYIEFLDWLLTWVWNNIYSGFSVDMKGLERVKAAVRKGSVILMPSHKSHLDYLVLSYIFYHNDLPPPHIAAGVNLSFWPLGHVFRKAGAFFLRRTFRGQRLYAAVFSTYLRKLLREGYVQEFFVEGTRSRTGKLLWPKLGMLSMELDAFAEGVSEDLQLVPISITYEKIVEESSYTKELGGGKKRKERFLDLLKSQRLLRKKYGRVYIQFAPPLSVREYLQSKRTDLTSLDGVRRRRIAEDLAMRVSYAINEVTTVTPSALVATVLLNHDKRGITLSELTKQASFLLHLLKDLGSRTSLVLQNLPWAVEEALGMFVSDRVVLRWDDPDGPIYMVEEGRRIQLDYYKNNIIHFFLPFALAGNVFRLYGRDRLPEQGLLDGLGLFMELFCREFLFPREDPVRTYWRTVYEHFVVRRNYLEVEGENEVRVAAPFPVAYVSRLLENYFESYFAFFHACDRLLGSGECEEKEFLTQVLRWAESLYRRGDVSHRESRSSFVFRNALDGLVVQGCIRRTRQKGHVILRLEESGRGRYVHYKKALSQVLFGPGLMGREGAEPERREAML